MKPTANKNNQDARSEALCGGLEEGF